jgi:hypothetical protein
MLKALVDHLDRKTQASPRRQQKWIKNTGEGNKKGKRTSKRVLSASGNKCEQTFRYRRSFMPWSGAVKAQHCCSVIPMVRITRIWFTLGLVAVYHFHDLQCELFLGYLY